MDQLQQDHIQSLHGKVIQVSSWKVPTDRPLLKLGNCAAQLAADTDNYQSATAQVCTKAKIATIGPSNIDSAKVMYVDQAPPIGFQAPPHTTHQRHQLPGDICRSILNGSRKKAVRSTCDLLDLPINLVAMHLKTINDDLHTLFDLLYSNIIPKTTQHFFTDTYFFYLYKDPKTSQNCACLAYHHPSDVSLQPMSPSTP